MWEFIYIDSLPERNQDLALDFTENLNPDTLVLEGKVTVYKQYPDYFKTFGFLYGGR